MNPTKFQIETVFIKKYIKNSSIMTSKSHSIIKHKNLKLPTYKLFFNQGEYVLESRDHHGRTPLHLSISLGHLESTKLLLEHGASALAENSRNWTGGWWWLFVGLMVFDGVGNWLLSGWMNWSTIYDHNLTSFTYQWFKKQ